MRVLDYRSMTKEIRYCIEESITSNILIACSDGQCDVNRFGHYFRIVWDIIKIEKNPLEIDLHTLKNVGPGIALEHNMGWATVGSRLFMLPITDEMIHEQYHLLNHALADGKITFSKLTEPKPPFQELK